MNADELLKCCEDPDCQEFCRQNLDQECRARGVPSPSVAPRAGAGAGDFISLFFQVLPVLLDLIQKWRQQQTQPATP